MMSTAMKQLNNADLTNKTALKFVNNVIFLVNWQGVVIAKWRDSYDNMNRAYKAYEKEFYSGERMVEQARRDRDYLHRKMIDKMLDASYAPARTEKQYEEEDIYDTYFI